MQLRGHLALNVQWALTGPHEGCHCYAVLRILCWRPEC